MIHYQVRCSDGHEFDGWFKDSTAFERLSSQGLVECPTCGNAKVTRALMAPAIARPERTRTAAPPPPEPPSQANEAVAPPDRARDGRTAGTGVSRMPDQMRASLQRLRADVERNCDYVGERFADEALRIHRGEAQARGIYGESTPEQADTLTEAGVTFARIPWIPRADG